MKSQIFKKGFFIGIMLILITLISCGCQEQNIDTGVNSKFVGFWKNDHEIMNNTLYIETWNFFVNKTAKVVITNETNSQIISTNFYKWEVKDDKLCAVLMELSDTGYQICGNYTFSNDDTTFTWIMDNQVEFIFNKI